MITGEYNALEYVIYSDGAEVYRAGNSPYESQGYVPADRGVGVDTMAQFCRQTAEELAAERGEEFGGVSLADESDTLAGALAEE